MVSPSMLGLVAIMTSWMSSWPEARQQLADMQLLGTDLVHGADHAAQHMVQAMVAARALNRTDIARLAHHANAGGVAHRVWQMEHSSAVA